ncbi:MAG: hypothetical protein BGO12_09745 [Verrucomicrobia bacterium 61-8]|nr:MAG: hypothetical protein BGO12_09745 [Verrucomicrobia bacterium 61-8]
MRPAKERFIESGLTMVNFRVISTLFSGVFRFAGAAGIVFLASLSDGFADEQKEVKTVEDSPSEISREVEDYRVEVVALFARLRDEQSPETRRAILEEIRAKSLARGHRFAAERAKISSESNSLAELKQAAAGNPELQERIAKIERRKAAFDELRRINDALLQASPEKQAELRLKSNKLRADLLATLESERIVERKAWTESEAKSPPPEMAALRAKSEERKRELDQLRETLEKASPEERAKLLEQWQIKRKQELASQAVRQVQ